MSHVAPPPAPTTDPMLDPRAAAPVVGVKPTTLARWRARRVGPPFHKINGKAVRYRQSELIAWVDQQQRVPRVNGPAQQKRGP